MSGRNTEIFLETDGVTRHLISKENELRVEVGEGLGFVKLLGGTAEIFGVEIIEGKTYVFSPSRKFAIFTWFGADILLGGSISSQYLSNESSMLIYANLHQRIEARREEAKIHAIDGPRVLITGPTDVGKSTLSRILAAYACRVGRSPILVDLDVGQGELSVPGTVSASPIHRNCLSPENEDGFTNIVPLVYYYGHTSPGEFIDVYKNSVTRLADTIQRRMNSGSDPLTRNSGMIINTTGWIEGMGYKMLVDIIKIFSADIILVLGNDRLFANLSTECKGIKYPLKISSSNSNIQQGISTAESPQQSKVVSVIKIMRSGGVVERSPTLRKSNRKSRIREYFYGPDPGPGNAPILSPSSITISFDDVIIVKVGTSSSTVDLGILPIGKSSTSTSTSDPLRISVIPPSISLLNNLLAVSFAATEKEVPHVNVAGFLHVTMVDVAKRTLTVLVPTAGPLPGKYLILGSISWVE
jgi:polyribonucleotide 5'-hydroxyl-kinase